MKNLISKIGLIFASVLIFNLVQVGDALATAPASLDEVFFDKLLAEAGTSRSQIMPDKIFQTNKGDERGQNLYFSISNEMMDKPLKEAIKKAVREFSIPHPKTGSAVFFTEDEWRAIYLSGATAAIKTNLGVDNQAMINQYYDMMIEYVEDEIDNFRFMSELKSLSSSTEIATDILIPDLEIMELILFGQVQASEYDNARASVGLPPTSTYAESESQDTAHTSSTVTPADTSSTSLLTTSKNYKAPADQSFADDKKEFPSPTSESSAVLYNPTGLNPLQCDSDSNIGDAFDDYLEELPPENPFTDFIPPRGDETSDDGEESEDGTPKKSPTGKEDTSASGSDDDSEVSSEDDFEEIEPAERHDWINEEFCTEGQKIFCIEVRFINNGQECEFGEGSANNCASIGLGAGGTGGSTNSSSGYYETDNCIACHTQFLLKNMDLLLSKTLTPSKAPGNLLESGKCKKSFGKVKPSLNIYAIKKPIPSPEDSNPLFQSSNPFEDFRREMNEGFGAGKGERADAVTKHVSAFSETRSAASIFGEIDDSVQARSAEIEFNEEMGVLQQHMDTYAKGYKDVSLQIETLNSLISATSDMNRDINENSCEDLRGKKTCQ